MFNCAGHSVASTPSEQLQRTRREQQEAAVSSCISVESKIEGYLLEGNVLAKQNFFSNDEMGEFLKA